MAGEITLAEIQARVPTDTWLRVFDRNGTGTADTTFAQQCVDDAISECEMRVEASLPQYLETKASAVNNAIKRHIAAVALFLGVQFNPSAGGSDKEPGPFAKAYKDALDFFDRLARDDRNRLADGTLARPVASAVNTTDSAGIATNPFTRAADGSDRSMF